MEDRRERVRGIGRLRRVGSDKDLSPLGTDVPEVERTRYHRSVAIERPNGAALYGPAR